LVKETSETSELSESYIDSKTKIEVLKIIEDLDNRGDFYIFNNREDLVEERTDWDELKDIAERFYYAIEDIKYLLNKN